MCADLASQQASPGNWPSDMAHQAFTADAVHDGSMRDGMVPSKPPGDASRSAGLPHQAGGGPQAGVPQGGPVPTTSMPGVASEVGQDSQQQARRKRKGDCMGDGSAAAAAATAKQGNMAADGMGATSRQGPASPSGGPAAPAGVFFHAGSCFTCMILEYLRVSAVSICTESDCGFT